MSDETKNPDTPEQQDDAEALKATKETNLGRIANEAARRGVRRQQRYDREHNIFTK